MISHSVEAAVLSLQRRALLSRDSYELDRIDRALDELLRNPSETTGASRDRAHSALGHAYEVLERRKVIAPTSPVDQDHPDCAEDEPNYVMFEILEWLRMEPELPERERIVLQELAQGGEAESLAQRNEIPISRMREQISRARSKARQIWKEKVLSA